MDASTRWPEPSDGSETDILVGWLRFHRDALATKASGLTAEQLTETAVPPSTLTILGLVRHLTEIERVYGAWAMGGSGELAYVWGDYVDGGPEWDFEVEPSMVEASMAPGTSEWAATDPPSADAGSLDATGTGNRAACVGTCRSSSASTPATTGTPTSSANASTAQRANDQSSSTRRPRFGTPTCWGPQASGGRARTWPWSVPSMRMSRSRSVRERPSVHAFSRSMRSSATGSSRAAPAGVMSIRTAAPVDRVGCTGDESAALQGVEDAGDGGRGDDQLLADLGR